MAGFNQWLMDTLSSGWNGLKTFSTDILDSVGIGTQRRAQEHDKEMLDLQQNYNTEREDIAWERTMEADNTKVQRNLEDLKESGLNPYMIYGSGSTPSSAPTASSASAGSGGRAPPCRCQPSDPASPTRIRQRNCRACR